VNDISGDSKNHPLTFENPDLKYHFPRRFLTSFNSPRVCIPLSEDSGKDLAVELHLLAGGSERFSSRFCKNGLEFGTNGPCISSGKFHSVLELEWR
jgi:hypothetical protein